MSQCASAGDTGTFPISCLGDEGGCEQPFSIQELERVLSSNDFEELLKASFATYIRTRPSELQYCPTPDCPQIYRITRNGSVFQCPTCLMSICTSCQVISHDGLTCEEYKDLSHEGSIAFRRWMEQNQVRPCPECKTPIQKSHGCNHMECRACKTHFCWLCMGIFSPSEIYRHMSSKHGNIGMEVADEDAQFHADIFRFLE